MSTRTRPWLVAATVLASAVPSALHGVVLYDQYNNAGTDDVTSQDFESAFDTFDDAAADDFVVPASGWTITGVETDGEYFNGTPPAASFHVFIYSDSSGLPGTLLYTRLSQPFADPGAAGNPSIAISPSIYLTAGHYWVAVQARQDFTPNGQWAWHNRTVTSNSPAAWRNPGNGFGTGCTAWTVRTVCIPTAASPDQVFRLLGSVGSTGLLIVGGEAIGYGANNYSTEAANIVSRASSASQAATNDFAIFQTHDPWASTVVQSAITGTGHTYSAFSPASLAGFTFSNYRVVVLNWDDTFLVDFSAAYLAAIPALEVYLSHGGVVWIQAAIQGTTDDNFRLPFDGRMTWGLEGTNYIVDTGSPMMTGLSSPITGNYASHADARGFLPLSHVVKRENDVSGEVTLFELSTTNLIFANGFANGNFNSWSSHP